jgi:hypothetical protein
MSTGFFYGQIVRIRVTRHGKEKIRPVVVVTPNEEMTEGDSRAATGPEEGVRVDTSARWAR